MNSSMKKNILLKTFAAILFGALFGLSAWAAKEQDAKNQKQELLIKLAPQAAQNVMGVAALSEFANNGGKIEPLFENWIKVEGSKSQIKELMSLKSHPDIEYVQNNIKLGLLTDYSIQDPLRKAALIKALNKSGQAKPAKYPYPDNPEIPLVTPQQRQGADPDFAKQWGMNDIGVRDAWKSTKGSPEMIVAVIDTGVDYTHEDLVPNLWYNKGETGVDANGKNKANNGIDDDKNGFVDDVIGWDFATNDNKPYDLSVDPMQLLAGGGNPGHGTHCAGNVAARADNGIGVAGVAPNVKIMSLRFITDKGEGTTEAAVKAIKYAVDNGAKVLSNSWGGEGPVNDPSNENKILVDVINYAKSKNVLFVAAAGNGRKGVGYNLDNDANPVFPGAYQIDNIVTVAALDADDNLGTFSNWGSKLVHIGAPGVVVYSTTVGSHYSDTVIDKYGFKATWDGTSMATPHVAGAAALWWSAHPNASYLEVKNALLTSVKKINALANKTVTGGKLDVKELMK